MDIKELIEKNRKEVVAVHMVLEKKLYLNFKTLLKDCFSEKINVTFNNFMRESIKNLEKEKLRLIEQNKQLDKMEIQNKAKMQEEIKKLQEDKKT